MARARPTARTADRHQLYERAVQAPAADAALLARWFRRAAGRPLQFLREDFCGTAAIAAAFVAAHPAHRALAVDADPAVLRAAQQRHRAPLPPAARARLQLRCADVRAVRAPRVDLIAALNFSYCVFHRRDELLGYLRGCRAALRPGGAVLLDVFGGGLAHRPFAERHRHAGFAHVWEQRAFDPGSHRVDCRIHFEFPDGSRLDSAFRYDWRMWTVPELRDLLAEAGLPQVQVLWQDPTTGGFRARRRAPADPHWLAYVTGRRP